MRPQIMSSKLGAPTLPLAVSSNLLEPLRMHLQKMETPMLSISAEILTFIFETCNDFPQVVAFASACKHTHAAWVTNSPMIIWSAAKSQIRSFDDALMAVNIYSPLPIHPFKAKKPRCEQQPSLSKPTKRGPFH